MSQTALQPRQGLVTREPQTRSPATVSTAVESPALAANLEHLRQEEQTRVDREQAERLAALRELARFD